MPLFTQELEFSDDYPTIEPSLKLDFANARALDPRITFTRASTATYVGRDGLIKTAGEDEARFDHDPTTGESLGLLIEASRTNLFQYNNNPTTNASGTATKSTVQIVLPSGETGPALETDADAFAENYRNITATSNTAPGYLTFYAKKKSSGSTGTLTITMEGGNTPRSFNSASINSDTWTKISTTHDWSAGTSTLRRYDIYFNGSGNTSDGDTSFYVAFQQFEEATFPTSYIPTSGATATRAVDDAVISGESFNSFFNPSEGTVICKYKKDHWPVAAGNIYFERVWEIGNGSDASNLNIFNDPTQTSGNNIRYRVRTNSTNVFGPLTTSTGSNQTPTVALGYAKDNFALAIDGTLVDTDTSGDLPAVDRLHIGGRYGGDSFDRFNNTISKLIYYPKRLTNTQLQTLTQ